MPLRWIVMYVHDGQKTPKFSWFRDNMGAYPWKWNGPINRRVLLPQKIPYFTLSFYFIPTEFNLKKVPYDTKYLFSLSIKFISGQ